MSLHKLLHQVPPWYIHPTETLQAREITVGSIIWYAQGGEWARVVTNYQHPRSPYAKLSIIPESCEEEYRIKRICGLYFKVGLSDLLTRQTKEHVMSVYLMNSSSIAQDIAQKLCDLSALQDAPPRVQVLPSVFVDKEVLLNTLRSDLKVLYSKLGEQIKKI